MGPKPQYQGHALRYLTAMTAYYLHMVVTGVMSVTTATAAFRRDTTAALQMTKALNLVYIFIGVFIGLAVLAALIQPFFIFLNNFVDNLTFNFGTSANDTLVESILAILVILVLLGGVIWVVAYALRLFKGSRGG